MRKIYLLTVLLIVITHQSRAQETEIIQVASFNKVIVSPRINVVFRRGDQELVEIRYSNIQPHQINVEVKNNKLHLFLDDSRWIEKQEKYHQGECSFKRNTYRDASVTAYVTYRELKKLVVRGEEEVRIDDLLIASKFQLNVFGEAEIRIASLRSDEFTARMYGGNKLKIEKGTIHDQHYKLFGGNKVDTHAVNSKNVSSTIYGDGLVKVSASKQMLVTSFGEPDIHWSGTAHLYKGIIIGKPHIRKEQ